MSKTQLPFEFGNMSGKEGRIMFEEASIEDMQMFFPYSGFQALQIAREGSERGQGGNLYSTFLLLGQESPGIVNRAVNFVCQGPTPERNGDGSVSTVLIETQFNRSTGVLCSGDYRYPDVLSVSYGIKPVEAQKVFPIHVATINKDVQLVLTGGYPYVSPVYEGDKPRVLRLLDVFIREGNSGNQNIKDSSLLDYCEPNSIQELSETFIVPGGIIPHPVAKLIYDGVNYPLFSAELYLQSSTMCLLTEVSGRNVLSFLNLWLDSISVVMSDSAYLYQMGSWQAVGCSNLHDAWMKR